MSESKSQKCVHKGCGKKFTDPDEPCVYHPGPPEFHEGQKGWKCCKPRVLTFDEFLEIPPCTTGKHSTVDDTPKEEKPQIKDEDLPKIKPIRKDASNGNVPGTKPIPSSGNMGSLASAMMGSGIGTPRSTTPQPPQLEEDSDEEGLEVKDGMSCKRRACGKSYDPKVSRGEETCVYHPGVPIFHEGSKGWTCCKRKVLEFDEFMRIEGCKERKGHCYVGKKQKDKDKPGGGNDGEEILEDVRSDYYQTPASVIVSYFLKKIDKESATVKFENKATVLDLPTSDGKRFKKVVEWWGEIDPDKSKFKIMGTKLEMTLIKAGDVTSWPVLRVGDRETGERIQVGRAGRA